MTNRQAILAALKTRLQAIEEGQPTAVEGVSFVTNAGAHVLSGEVVELGPDDPPAVLCIVVGDDSTGYQGEQVLIDLPIEIQAVAKADLEDPQETIEAVLADIKYAIELSDRTLGKLVKRHLFRGPTRNLDREPGSTTVDVGILYTAQYTEVWGNP